MVIFLYLFKDGYKKEKRILQLKNIFLNSRISLLLLIV